MKPTINLDRPLSPLRLLSSFLASRPRLTLTLAFLIVYLLTVAWNFPLSSHDPSSLFFSKNHGYDKSYSNIREAQALSFINTTNSKAQDSTSTSAPPSSPSLCLGIATVARPTVQYITLTVGSVLEGLTPSERSQIHFVFFIAHTDPTQHPVYHEPWTSLLPDTHLSYLGVPSAQLSSIRSWESDRDYRSKGLFDYSYLLSACYAKTNAPYIAILEGDVLAARGWYPRAIAAAEHIDDLDTHDLDTPFHPPNPSLDYDTPESDLPPASWLYLRLFHTEAYLGWNKEFWATYCISSVLVFLVLATSLIATRTFFRPHLSRILSNGTIFLILFVFLPLSIGLFFALGRPTVLPLPRPVPTGAQKMDNFGCCSQGFVFPRRMVPFVRKRIEERAVDYIDMLMEAAAARWGLDRWVVAPSLLQHLGGESSKGDAVADARARNIWNFGFERWPEGGASGL